MCLEGGKAVLDMCGGLGIPTLPGLWVAHLALLYPPRPAKLHANYSEACYSLQEMVVQNQHQAEKHTMKGSGI